MNCVMPTLPFTLAKRLSPVRSYHAPCQSDESLRAIVTSRGTAEVPSDRSLRAVNVAAVDLLIVVSCSD